MNVEVIALGHRFSRSSGDSCIKLPDIGAVFGFLLDRKLFQNTGYQCFSVWKQTEAQDEFRLRLVGQLLATGDIR